MAHFAVTYTYADSDQLDELRPRHREFLGTLTTQGLLASGPLTETRPARALLLVQAADAEAARALLAPDPFQQAGLVAEVAVEAWNPVIGVFASH